MAHTDTAHEPLQEVLDSLPQHVAVLDARGTVVLANRVHPEVGGVSVNPFEQVCRTGVPYADLCWEAVGDPALSERATAAVESVMRGDLPSALLEYRSGERWFAMYVTPRKRPGVVVSHVNVTGQKRVEEQIRWLAHYDALTGLLNRSAFYEEAGTLLAQVRGAAERAFLVYIDLDGFKEVNDRYGHGVGDALLRAVAERFKEQLRAGDVLARLGGDEFVAFVRADPGGPETGVVGRLLGCLAEPFSLAGADVRVGASIGVTGCPDDGDDIETLLKGADTAMYRSKRCGGGVQAFS